MSSRRIIVFVAAALALFATPAFAQGPGIDAISSVAPTLTGRIVQIFLVVTVLSLAPGIAMMVTCLPFIVVVLSILRQAVGLQQAPPNMVIVSLALFLTYFVMEPVFTESWAAGVKPFLENEIPVEIAFQSGLEPFRSFMLSRVSDEALIILNESRLSPVDLSLGTPPTSLLVPAFLLSELQRAFEVGFVVLLPFLIIDLVIASVLMAMGMMMVPPAIVSLPFKVAFFVLTNGWIAISGALVRGYA